MTTKVKGILEASKHRDWKGKGVSLKEAKKYLQIGDISEVAKEVGIGKVQASKVMNGKSTNWAFTEKIIARAEYNKAIKERSESL